MRGPVQRFLWLRSFPPPSPRAGRPCSTASQVLRAHPTSPPLVVQACGSWPSLNCPASSHRARRRSPSFCAGNFPACAGSPTARDCPRTRIYRPGSCCLPHRLTASASRISDFAAQWLTRRFPLSTLQRRPRERLRMTRGRNDLLDLFRIELSSTISCQLWLAH